MSLANIILSCCLYLSFLRATNIGLFYPPDELDLGLINYTPQEICNYILLAGNLAYFFLKDDLHFIVKSLSKLVVALVFSCLILSAIFSINPYQSVKFIIAVLAISLPMALYNDVYGIEKTTRAIARFVIAMVLVNLAYIIAFPQYGIMVGKHEGALRGMFEHKNTAGPFYSIGFLILWDQIRKSAIRPQILAWGALLICGVFILFSKSSTAIVVFAAMLVFYGLTLFMLRLKNVWERCAILLGIFAFLALIIAFGGDALMQLFFETTGKDATFSGRTGIWEALFRMSQDRPLLGYGAGMTERPEFIALIYSFIPMEIKTSHNSFIDLILGIGYPAALMFTLFTLRTWIGAFFYQAKRLSELRSQALYISVLFAMLLIAFTSAGAMIGRNVFWLFTFSALLALSGGIARHSRQVQEALLKGSIRE